MNKKFIRNITTSKWAGFSPILRQAFEIKKKPLLWEKAISAGVCAAVPVLIGLLLGNLQYGLLAGIGNFSYLYMFNEPYAQRAKKIFFVMIGISASVGLGTLLAPYPYATALMIGLIGAVVTFIFGALKIPGPAAIFFVLTFSMTSAMEIDPSAAPLRAGLVLLGGLFAWLVAMSGWFFKPHEPEKNAIMGVYTEVALLLDSVGTGEFSEARQRMVQKLKEAEETLLAGYTRWNETSEYKKLHLLYEQANMIFSDVLEFYASSKSKLPKQLGESLRTFSNSIGKRVDLEVLQADNDDGLIHRLVSRIEEVQDIINESEKSMAKEIHITKEPLKRIFGGNLHKNSIVFISALRYGFILMIAALIAFGFEFERSYWIPLSCAAVMLGSTIMSTFHRSIQRSVGTVIGILVASMLLSTHPGGYMIVIIILILTFLTELFIPLNYAVALFFITPNAIFMAENTTEIYDISYFATARITDIAIGCAIGLIGTYIIGRRSASSRLPHLIAKSIRSQMQFLMLLFSEQGSKVNVELASEKRKMMTNLNNLRIVYATALNEIPRDKKSLGYLWPVIFSVEQLGYLLESTSNHARRPALSDKDLAQLLLVFEMMAIASEQKLRPNTRYVPKIEGFPQIQNEIADLQAALQIEKKAEIV